MVGRLTIPTLEGNVYREASGTEELKREKYNKDTEEYEIKELAYGDPSSNAESMAFVLYFPRKQRIMKNIPDKYKITGEITLQFSYLDKKSLDENAESS